MSKPQEKNKLKEMRGATPPEPEPVKKWFVASPPEPEPTQKKQKEKTESR
jgi:hypothetical protein